MWCRCEGQLPAVVVEVAFFTVVWSWRGENVRVISMRRAHEQEIRKYREAHGS